MKSITRLTLGAALTGFAAMAGLGLATASAATPDTTTVVESTETDTSTDSSTDTAPDGSTDGSTDQTEDRPARGEGGCDDAADGSTDGSGITS